jgi:hypothetical protein
MSEKVYRFLLHLYPSRFRRQYAEEAVQVFRDRLRDERGVLKRARLWVDMLRDLMMSAPREHSRTAVRPARTASGVPSFLVLEEEPLRPDMFLLGTVLALLALGTFGYLLTHGGNRVHFPGMLNQSLRSAIAPAAGGSSAQERPAPSEEGGATPVPLLTADERDLVIRRVIDSVQNYDSVRAEGQSVADFLKEQENLGAYDRILSGPVFAGLLTREINGIAWHEAVAVMCGQEPAPGSSIWGAPARPGKRAWLRIDDHFSVALEPVRQGLGMRD